MIDNWSLVKDYLITKPLTSIIKRKDFIRTMKSMGMRETTADTYRNYLSVAGYLGIMGEKRGLYFIFKHPEKGLSMKEVRQKAYGKF